MTAWISPLSSFSSFLVFWSSCSCSTLYFEWSKLASSSLKELSGKLIKKCSSSLPDRPRLWVSPSTNHIVDLVNRLARPTYAGRVAGRVDETIERVAGVKAETLLLEVPSTSGRCEQKREKAGQPAGLVNSGDHSDRLPSLNCAAVTTTCHTVERKQTINTNTILGLVIYYYSFHFNIAENKKVIKVIN